MRIFLFLALVLSFAFSQAKVLTEEEAIKKALKNNFEIKAEKKAVKAKEYKYKASKGMRWPRIDLYANFLRTNNPGYAMMNTLNQKRLDINTSSKYVDMTSFNALMGRPIFKSPSYPEANNWQTKLQAQIPIYTGGKISTAQNIYKKDYKAEKHQLKRTKEKTIYNVLKAYKGAILAKDAIKIAQEAFNTAKRHYEVAKKMYENGMLIYADVLRAKIYMMKMKNKITQAKSQYLTAKKALLLAIGDTDTKPEDIEVDGHLSCLKPDKDVNYYEKVAVNSREDLIALKKKVLIAKDMIKLTKSDFLPSIGAFAFYEMDSKNSPVDPDGKWWGVGVGLTWNIFNGFQKLNRYKSAKEEYKKYKNQVKGFEEYVKFKVYESYKKYITAVENYQTQEENLKYANEILRVTEKSFKNGMVSMLDLIDTQTMRDKINFDLNQTKYQCEIQKLELEYNAGIIKQK